MTELSVLSDIWGEQSGVSFLPYLQADGVFIESGTIATPFNKLEALKTYVEKLVSAESDAYFTPAVFKADAKKYTKANFLSSQVLWCDFDGNAPDYREVSPKPSLVVQTSGPLNQHWYWFLSEPCTDPEVIESLNRMLVEKFSADKGGWAVNKLLRIPTSKNFKPGKDSPSVAVLDYFPQLKYATSMLQEYVTAQPVVEQINLGEIPQPKDVWEKLGDRKPSCIDEWFLLPVEIEENGKASLNGQQFERSDKMYRIAAELVEAGASDEETYSLLAAFNIKWQWKTDRNRARTLKTIIEKVRASKIPTEVSLTFDGLVKKEVMEEKGNPNELMGDDEVIAQEVDWLWYPRFQIGANNIIAADGGTGKSTFALWLASELYKGSPNFDKDGPFHGVKKHTFWYNAFEERPENIKNKMKALGTPGAVKMLGDTQAPLDDIVLASSRLRAILAANPDIGMIVVDSITNHIKGDANQATTVSPYLKVLSDIAKEFNIVMLILHHTKKGPDSGDGMNMSGSRDWFNKVRIQWSMAKNDEGDRFICQMKWGGAPTPDKNTFNVSSSVVELPGLKHPVFISTGVTESEEDFHKIVASNNMKLREVLEGKVSTSDISKDTVKRLLLAYLEVNGWKSSSFLRRNYNPKDQDSSAKEDAKAKAWTRLVKPLIDSGQIGKLQPRKDGKPFHVYYLISKYSTGPRLEALNEELKHYIPTEEDWGGELSFSGLLGVTQ